MNLATANDVLKPEENTIIFKLGKKKLSTISCQVDTMNSLG